MPPIVAVGLEPMVNDAVVFMSLAPKTLESERAGLLCLRLFITNDGGQPVHLKSVKVSFLPNTVKSTSYAFDIVIPVHATTEWNLTADEDIFLPATAPDFITVSLDFEGFPTPTELTYPLAPYEAPGGGYRFPTDPRWLTYGEFWQGASGSHPEGSWGSQLFAYDLGVIGFDPTTHSWSPLFPGKAGDANSDFRVWGKPVCAVADGTVIERVDGVPNNPKPLHWTSDSDLQMQLAQQQASYWGTFPHGGAGNHFYVQHGENIVLYAHMQDGSLDPLLQNGTAVKAGAVLGLAGNAGNATAPHLHVHAIKGTVPEEGPLRPMPFRDTLAIDLAALTTPYQNAPWALLDDQGPSHNTSAIYPAARFLPPIDRHRFRAIDPLALILSETVYQRLTLPDPPPLEIFASQVLEMARALSPAERRTALTRLATFSRTYLVTLERALIEAGVVHDKGKRC